MDDDAVALHERRGGCGELPETAQGMTLKRFGYSC